MFFALGGLECQNTKTKQNRFVVNVVGYLNSDTRGNPCGQFRDVAFTLCWTIHHFSASFFGSLLCRVDAANS